MRSESPPELIQSAVCSIMLLIDVSGFPKVCVHRSMSTSSAVAASVFLNTGRSPRITASCSAVSRMEIAGPDRLKIAGGLEAVSSARKIAEFASRCQITLAYRPTKKRPP